MTPDLHDDDHLQAALAQALHEPEEVPDAAVAAALAAFDVGRLEGELARLVSDSAGRELSGVRHDGEATDRLVCFASSACTFELDLPVDEDVLLGQLDPPDLGSVVVEIAEPDGAGQVEEVVVDDLGRFRVAIGAGTVRIRVTTATGAVVTPWITR
jgi:hypothetical protein